jgi:hypothetical protein
LNIVGYFHANERSDEFELGGVAKNIGDHITRYFPQAAILLVCDVNFADLGLNSVVFVFHFFVVPFSIIVRSWITRSSKL